MTDNELQKLRDAIDCADAELLEALAKRMKTSRSIGAYKKTHGIAPLDTARWEELLQKRSEEAQQKGLSPQFIEKLYTLIHQESVAVQENI